jgi:hypothetical protein
MFFQRKSWFNLSLEMLAAAQPMTGEQILTRMRKEFNEDELKHIAVSAGSALAIYGAKETAGDVDGMVDSKEALEMIARNRRLRLSSSELNNEPRLQIGDWCELFYDPVLFAEVKGKIKQPTQVIDGVKVDTPEALVSWYRMMVRRRGLPKDHDNLKLAMQLYKK